MTSIYIYDLDQEILDESIINNLPKSIKDRIKKYNIKNNFQSSLISWYILYNKLYSDFGIEISEVKENKYHKPYIDGIHFNITHSNNLIVVMISNNECGIDVEMIKNKLDYHLLSKKILSKEEYNEFIQSKNQNEYVVKKWTQKEACFKELGTGIVFSDLTNIDTSNIVSKKINDLKGNEYYLSYTNDSKVEIEYVVLKDIIKSK